MRRLGRTVSRILRRRRLSRMAIEPPAPAVRYERAEPGEMIHLDIKKLGRFEQVGHRITGDPSSRATEEPAKGSAGSMSMSHRRCLTPGLRQHPARRKSRQRRPVLKAAVAYYKASASPLPA